MHLVIAEKPSVARDLATVLGAKVKGDGFYSGGDYIVSWCVGHLVSLAEAAAYDARYKRWNRHDLPIIPKKFAYTVDASKQKQVTILKNLMNRPDVSHVINACDAGREGELIFRLVYNYNKCTKPTKRLWISSMENSAITQGFAKLKSGDEYQNLYHAAACRMSADWLVGINATRLFSTLYDSTLNVGRVMTPTLALLVERQQAIEQFVVEPFYTIELDTNSGDDAFVATHTTGKFKDKIQAESLLSKCSGHPATVTNIDKNKKTQAPPKLYDLTSLQRDANRMFGYTAQQTLDLAQSLYEKKLITYPRTDSKFLTSDMEPSLLDLARSINMYSDELKTKPLINNKGVTDHHAIIITKSASKAKTLTPLEKNILNMVAIRFIAAMSPRHEYMETVVTLTCNDEPFTAKGKTVTKEGFKAIEAKLKREKKTDTGSLPEQGGFLPTRADDEPQGLPKLKVGQAFDDPKLAIKEGKTSPPKPYTEASLLSAMEHAKAVITEEEEGETTETTDSEATADTPTDKKLTEKMVSAGLGTPATRAGIIEKLVKTGFAQRKGKSLLPSDKGTHTIAVMPDSLKTPLLTAQWEDNLKQVERGELGAGAFMRDIQNFVAQVVHENQQAQRQFIGVFPKNEYKKKSSTYKKSSGEKFAKKEEGS